MAEGSRALDSLSTSARRTPARYRRAVSENQDAALEGEAPLANLRSSARGWHGIQLAVLGFIGLCGVLQGNGEENPDWVSEIAALLVVGSLVLACLAVAVVGTVAWPVDGSRGGDEGGQLVQGSRRLRGGIALTFLAVAALAAGATSGWWPVEEAPSSAVEVSTRAGVVCGELVEASPGSVGVRVGGRTVVLSLDQVSSLRSVEGCN